MSEKPPVIIDVEDLPEIENGSGAQRLNRCDNCDASQFPKKGQMGECRFGTPSVFIFMIPMQNPITKQVQPTPMAQSAWPSVRHDNWCKKHVAKPGTRH